jgi:NitT/TauT family transport system substrate-binding protein
MNKSSMASLTLAALLVTWPLASTAAESGKVVLAVAGMEKQIYLPAKLCEQLGYFKAEGLDVELINTRAGVDAENELIAGEVQAVVGFYDHTIDIQSKGKSIISIVQLSRAPGEVELVAAKQAEVIKGPADFKGKTLGITGAGSSTDFLTQALATRAGLKPGDYTTIGVGAGNTFIAAIKQGRIDAGMTTEPTISQMISTGEAKVLIDMRSVESTTAVLGGTYPAASLYVSTPWLEKNAETAQKLANAMVKTLRWMAVHTASEIADKMPKEYFVGNQGLYVKGLADGKSQFTPDGRMPAGGPETVLRVLQLASKSVQGKTIDLSKTYTTRYVDEALKVVK